MCSTRTDHGNVVDVMSSSLLETTRAANNKDVAPPVGIAVINQ